MKGVGIMNSNEKGFTLIELVVVIAVLAILAGVAIPRFINITTDARIATLRGLQGGINGAVALAQAKYKASGSSGTSVDMDGTTVTVISGTGRPEASSAGIEAAMQSLDGFSVTHSGGGSTFDFSTGAITNCNAAYTDSSGQVAVTTSGC